MAGVYAVAWVGSIFGVIVLCEAARRVGEAFGGRAATWIVALAVAGFTGGFVGAMVTGAAQ